MAFAYGVYQRLWVHLNGGAVNARYSGKGAFPYNCFLTGLHREFTNGFSFWGLSPSRFSQEQ